MMSEQQLLGSGADGQFLADFRSLAEAASFSGEQKYPARVLGALAQFLVGRGGAGHRDTPLFELCHLVNIVAGAAGADTGSALDNLLNDRWRFFFGQDRVTAAGCRAELQALQARSGWRRAGFAWAENGVAVSYGDDVFTVTYGRMPFLLALFEFLAGMDNFTFHQALNDLLDQMAEMGDSPRAIQDGANGIAVALRRYRNAHLEQGMHDEAFTAILDYLRQRGDERNCNLADDDILEFWRRHNGGDFRTYRKAFTRFADFTAAMAVSQARRQGEGAAPLGGARDLGEVEPDDMHHSSAALGDLAGWTDPLALLDAGPAAEIKFFTQSGEREPLAPLAAFGPFARQLPLAFSRYLAFGTVQAAITTALQFHPGRAVEARLLSCAAAEPYAERRQLYQKLQGHLARLRKAAFHALTQVGDQLGDQAGGWTGVGRGTAVTALAVMTPERLFELARRELDGGREPSAAQMAVLSEDAAKVFRTLSRRGFEAEALADEGRQEGFRVGAGVLSALGDVLNGYLGGLDGLDQDSGLDTLFAADSAVFATEFGKLYGARDD